MREVQFKGRKNYERFDPIQVSFEGLAKEEARNAEIISNMQQANKNNIDQRNQYLDGLRNKFNAEQDNRNELQQWEKRTRETRDAAIRQRREGERQRFVAEEKNIQNAQNQSAQLMKFSKTLFEKSVKFIDDRNQSAMEDEYQKALAEGLPSSRQLALAMNEQQLKATGEATDAVGDILAKTGEDAYTVTQVRTGNKWRDYGRLKAYSVMAGNQYGNYLEGELAKLGEEGLDPVVRAGAIKTLQMEYLKDNQLYGLSADFLGDMFTSMRSANNASIKYAREQSAIIKGNESILDARTALGNAPSAANAEEFVKAYSRSYKSDGKTMQGNKAAVDELFAILEDTRLVSDEQLREILTNAYRSDGTPYTAFKIRISELEQKRSKNKNDLATLDEKTRRRNAQDLEQQIIEQVLNGEPPSLESLNDVISKIESMDRTYDPTRLKDLATATQDNLDEKKYLGYMEAALMDGTLTYESLRSDATIPPKYKSIMLQKMQRDPRFAGATKFNESPLKKFITKELREKLDATQLLPNGLSTEGSLDLAVEQLVSDAKKVYLDEYTSGAGGPGGAAKAQEVAKQFVLKELSQPYDPKENPKGQGNKAYQPTLIPDEADKKEFGFFTRVSPNAGNTQRFKKVQAKVNTIGIDALGQEGGLLIDAEQLTKLHKRLKYGEVVTIPPAYQSIIKFDKDRYLKGIDARTALDLNFKLLGLEPPPRPSTILNKGRDLMKDPEIIRLLNDYPTRKNQGVAILQSDVSQYSAKTSRGQELVVMATRNNWDASDLAAIFLFETGTMDPAQPGVGAAEGRIGLIQAGPEERSRYGLGSGDWSREILGVEKYLLDRGATPGMDINQLYEVINSGSPGGASITGPDGNGILPMTEETGRLLEARRQEAMEMLGMTPSAANSIFDPNYMSASLVHFYTTGTLTNGGYSEHLDIKQADDPDTPQNEFGTYFDVSELDQFIQFTDPDYGNVTLSQLRTMHGTTPGMDFGAHREYGPHVGWDYPTKDGTKLFLRGGATVVRKERTSGNGVRTTIRLPDGRFFNFLHGE